MGYNSHQSDSKAVSKAAFACIFLFLVRKVALCILVKKISSKNNTQSNFVKLSFSYIAFWFRYGILAVMNKTKSGFIAIIGPTNAGKSTLINQIMGRKVSAVSHKVQTTRSRLRAVKMVDDVQLIFVDTPGVFRPSRRLDRAMVGAAMDALSDADAVLLMIDAKHGITQTTKDIVIKINNIPLFAFINKSDAVKKDILLPMIADLSEMAQFREIFYRQCTEW